MTRATGVWFGVSGVLSVFTWAVFTFSDPSYYDASSLLDYAAVVALTGSFVVTGIALILLWRQPAVKRGSLFVLLAGIGAIAEGMGNLLEDAFGVEDAVWLFFGGGLLMLISLVIAGIAALTVAAPGRWSGLFLLFAAPGAMLGLGGLMMGVSWILFGLWIIYQHRAFLIALAVAIVPVLLLAVDLYWADLNACIGETSLAECD